jgi:small-conductance mechanosensitive channel
MLDQHPISHQMARGVVTAVVVSLIYTAAGRFLFKPVRNGMAVITISHPGWHLRMIVAYGVINAFFSETVRLGTALNIDGPTLDGWFLLGNTLLTLQKLAWFIGGRTSIRSAFVGERPGLVRRVIGNLLPDFYVISAVVIWLAGFLVAGTPHSARWSIAANSTQVILLAVPVVALGAHALINELVRYSEQNHAPGLGTAVLASLRVVVSGAAWIGGLHLITAVWQPLMDGNISLATGVFIWLERLSLAIVGSWAVCTLIWKYFESISPSPQITLPGHDDEQEKRPTSRLTTALPVVRNLALGAVLAVGGLLVLSAIGINVAPLLAGFGVLGLALSFGSQALVKDVVSGIFFITDDAFRIGEYIDTGRLKGTVEQITVRSIRLRHHNGPVHTIPFGQISSVTNFSRDWGTIKFELRFERDADAELIRKVTKKVGQAMLEDPEYGAEFLIPLKMQGIQDITESSMVVRFKFTSRPGNPSIIKREAMKRLIIAFREAGLEFASNAVTVRSHGITPSAASEGAAAAAIAQAPAPKVVAT